MGNKITHLKKVALIREAMGMESACESCINLDHNGACRRIFKMGLCGQKARFWRPRRGVYMVYDGTGDGTQTQDGTQKGTRKPRLRGWGRAKWDPRVTRV